MNIDDLKTTGVIPTLDMAKFMGNLFGAYEKYPKNSISQREIVQSIDLGDMSVEEAQKIADKLNDEVTNTILNFQNSIHKKKSKKD